MLGTSRHPMTALGLGGYRFRRPRRLLAAAACVSLIAGGWASCCEARSDEGKVPSVKSWDTHKLGAKSTLSLVWVGHSLMEHKAPSTWGEISLMSLVGRFAESRKLSYAMTDHTLFGSPLSALWRGQPHSYFRNAGEMVGKREALEGDAGRHDAIVLTEAIPLKDVIDNEFSPYYLRRFYCSVLGANPSARVYLFQSWVDFPGSPRGEAKAPSDRAGWREEMEAERVLWHELADIARTPAVEEPHWLRRLGWSSVSDGGCKNEDPIYSVPVGSALLVLDERVSAPRPGDHFVWPDGKPFLLTDMVENPMVSSPDGSLSLRDPSKPFDGIHANLAGIYFSALVHFSTLYRQTPVDLPYPTELGKGLAKSLQCVAWEVVTSDERTGVKGDANC